MANIHQITLSIFLDTRPSPIFSNILLSNIHVTKQTTPLSNYRRNPTSIASPRHQTTLITNSTSTGIHTTTTTKATTEITTIDNVSQLYDPSLDTPHSVANI
jgi:hypothetical protein